MEVIIFASGSKGNSLIIKGNDYKLLVDVGLSYPKLIEKIKEEKININNINALLITHEHSDHIKGLKRFVQNHPNIKLYLTKGTLKALNDNTKECINNYEIIKASDVLLFNNLKVSTYEWSHDANEPIGFVFEEENKKVVIATDTGYIDEQNFKLLKNANLYILEANHEPSLLMDSKRPYYLKQRIISYQGHLSNNEAAELIDEFIKEIDKSIWVVAHISEDCNTQLHIEKAIVNFVKDPTKLEVIYSSQETLGKILL